MLIQTLGAAGATGLSASVGNQTEPRDEKGWVAHVFKRGEAQKENDVPQV